MTTSHRRPLFLATSVTAALLVAVSGAALVAPSAAAAAAEPPTRATRAGLDPALTADRGARTAAVELEAENARTSGTVLAPSREAYTIPSEASGRSAVSLARGQWVDVVLPQAADAITVRYSIPDAPSGGGIDSPLAVSVGNAPARTMTLTSKYSWLYNQYPFTNDPRAGVLHPDWWITECQCVPAATTPAPTVATPFRPFHFFDEQRMLLGRTVPAGTHLRFSVPARAAASTTVLDLVETERIAAPRIVWRAANVLLFGADPTGRRDAAPAFDRAIAFAHRTHLPVYIPPGVYSVSRHIVVDDVTIEGAGSWYTIVRGTQQTLATPAPDGSVHTGVGFYGRYAADGGSRNVHLSGFAIEGDVRERVDTDQVNGVGGALTDSSVEGLYLHHTKVGVWLDGPMARVTVRGNVIADQIADGINLHTGVTDSTIVDNRVRNTGDDGIALWSEKIADARVTVDHNTVQSPVLANGIAVYGGTDTTVSSNLVADPVREGSGIHAGSRFGATPFAGYLRIADDTTVRAGPFELNWRIGLGAIWIYALESSIDADLEVTGDHLLDSGYNAILLVADFPVKDLYSITNVHFRDLRIDGTGTSVLSARVAGTASFENVDARNVGAVGINNCGSFHFTPQGSEFAVEDRGGNDGGGTTGRWLDPWELPNTITCDDRPPVIPPPPPSPWN